MAAPEPLIGQVVRGQGQGRQYTQLDWVRQRFLAQLGIDPYPGTLNLRLMEPASLERWRQLRATPGVAIEPASADFCWARCYSVALGSERLPAAIVLPDVPGYPDDTLELIAAVALREALGLRDGAEVAVWVEAET